MIRNARTSTSTREPGSYLAALIQAACGDRLQPINRQIGSMNAVRFQQQMVIIDAWKT